MSGTDKEREAETHRLKEGERGRETERCKMERITNECAAEREP